MKFSEESKNNLLWNKIDEWNSEKLMHKCFRCGIHVTERRLLANNELNENIFASFCIQKSEVSKKERKKSKHRKTNIFVFRMVGAACCYIWSKLDKNEQKYVIDDNRFYFHSFAARYGILKYVRTRIPLWPHNAEKNHKHILENIITKRQNTLNLSALLYMVPRQL